MIRDKYSLVSELYELKDDMANSGREVCVRGWVRTNRNNGHIGFMAVNDLSLIHILTRGPPPRELGELT